MRLPPPYQRQTTTSLRRRRTRMAGIFLLLGAFAALLIAWQALGGGKDAGSQASLAPLDPCLIQDCPAPEEPSLQRAEPCPYCDQDPGRWQSLTSVQPPEILGTAATVLEGSCGRLIYGLEEGRRLAPASLTKIVTALVVMDEAELEDRVPIDLDGWRLVVEDESSIMGLEAGMNLSVEELLFGLLLPSGNDAALALAEHLGGMDRFVALMNEAVQSRGLADSRFANPDGRDASGSYTSALDIVLLGHDLMQEPDLRRIAGTQTFLPDWEGHLLWNANYLVYGYEGATGVKIGFTEAAKETIVGSAERDGREIFVSVLGSDFAYVDAVKLLDWAFDNTQPAC